MLNSSLLKQYQPIRCNESLDVATKGICQKPLLASSLLNTAVPANWASVSSTAGKRYTYLNTLEFSGFKSM